MPLCKISERISIVLRCDATERRLSSAMESEFKSALYESSMIIEFSMPCFTSKRIATGCSSEKSGLAKPISAKNVATSAMLCRDASLPLSALSISAASLNSLSLYCDKMALANSEYAEW